LLKTEETKLLLTAGLLDVLLRDKELEAFTNKNEISICSFESAEVTMGYLLQDQTDEDMRELRLWSDDMPVEGFMTEFGIETAEDLEKITLEDLWVLYRADKGYIGLSNGPDAVDIRIGDGVNSVEEALVYGMSHEPGL
jgi:hypothetical protein